MIINLCKDTPKLNKPDVALVNSPEEFAALDLSKLEKLAIFAPDLFSPTALTIEKECKDIMSTRESFVAPKVMLPKFAKRYEPRVIRIDFSAGKDIEVMDGDVLHLRKPGRHTFHLPPGIDHARLERIELCGNASIPFAAKRMNSFEEKMGAKNAPALLDAAFEIVRQDKIEADVLPEARSTKGLASPALDDIWPDDEPRAPTPFDR